MKDFIKTLLRILLPAILVLLFGFLFLKSISLFIPFIIAWLISLLVLPITKKINKKLKLKSKFFNKLIISVVIASLIALITLIIYKICEFIPELVVYIINELNKLNFDFGQVTPLLTEHINFDLIKQYISDYSEQILDASGKVLDVISDVPAFLINVVVTIIATYYFVAEEVDFNKYIIKIMPESFLKHYKVIKDNAKQMFVQYFVAQLKISGVVFLILLIGFGILGIKNFFIIALLTTILDLLPVFGTGAVLWPWSLYHVISGNYQMAIGLMIVYLISQGFRQIIQPKLISDTVGISSLLTLFFMYIGFVFAGIGGMIIAVPVGVFFINLIKAGLFDEWIADLKHLLNLISNYLHKDKE
jgi:sporulation integral membrane protein YtvI